MKKLGFGCMRLPITDQNNQTSVDFKQFCDMVDSFIEQVLHTLIQLICITILKVKNL